MGSHIQCFLVVTNGRLRRRVYAGLRTQVPSGSCPHYYEAEIDEIDTPEDDTNVFAGLGTDHRALLPPVVSCLKCNAVLDEGDLFIGLSGDPLYVRQDEPAAFRPVPLHLLPVGAMWWGEKWPGFNWDNRADDADLFVRTPGGSWDIDSRASNCTMPGDRTHRCWPRRGTPPVVTVNKGFGPTCGAGLGSIKCGSYHGFLVNGFLDEI